MIWPNDATALGPDVRRPSYDRSRLTAGIAHIGVGGFHRSHQAAYLDDLLELGVAHDWAIAGIGLLPGDVRMRDAMRAQDCSYTLVLKHPDGRCEVRVIGSIIEYHFAPDDPAAVVERLADPAIRIVSLTITEGGYGINPGTGAFDPDSDGIAHDLAAPATPRTAFGLVVESLRLRKLRGIAPYAVLSCDNMQGNGDIARRAFATFADLRDPELGRWLRESVSFPNTMVDRITPQTTQEDREALAMTHGIDDAWPVVAEPFAQWVIEDRFPSGRPDWDRVGAQITHDVTGFEAVKLRLLNASHQAMAYFGSLMGYRRVHEAVADPLIRQLLWRYWVEEAIPTLRPVPGIDPHRYVETLLDRYGNPAIGDSLARLCVDASDRIPTFLLPVIRAQIATGGPIGIGAAVVASWARYAEGVDDQGDPLPLEDPRRERVITAARRRDRPLAFIEDAELFGDLAQHPAFSQAFQRAVDLLRTSTARSALERIL